MEIVLEQVVFDACWRKLEEKYKDVCILALQFLKKSQHGPARVQINLFLVHARVFFGSSFRN